MWNLFIPGLGFPCQCCHWNIPVLAGEASRALSHTHKQNIKTKLCTKDITPEPGHFDFDEAMLALVPLNWFSVRWFGPNLIQCLFLCVYKCVSLSSDVAGGGGKNTQTPWDQCRAPVLWRLQQKTVWYFQILSQGESLHWLHTDCAVLLFHHLCVSPQTSHPLLVWTVDFLMAPLKWLSLLWNNYLITVKILRWNQRSRKKLVNM